MAENPYPVPELPRRAQRRFRPHVADGPVLPSKREQQKMRNPPPEGLASWWPVAIGVALAFFAPDLSRFATAYDPWGMRLIFPYVLFCGRPELGLSDELARTLPQLMLYLQFPLEGLLTELTFRRGVGLPGAIGQLVFLHLAGALVLFLVSGAAPP